MYDKPQSEQELSDAEMARKLQEEELLVSREDALDKSKELASDDSFLTHETFLIYLSYLRPKILLLCRLVITFASYINTPK